MTVHVRTWSGSKSAVVTEMLNAGKRGKKCRVLRFNGAQWDAWHGNELHKLAAHHTTRIMGCISAAGGHPFDEVAQHLRQLVAQAQADGVTSCIDLSEGEIRGVDAPRERLSCVVAGKFTAAADEEGICLCDLVDQHNQPAMITSGQSESRAYDIARKCWDLVTAAPSFQAAGDVLSAHGAKLHYYCRMD